MGIRGLRHRDQQADLEPRAARAGLSQIVGPAAPSCPGRRGRRGVQKNFAQSLAQIAEQQAASQPIEIWFQDEARIGQKNKITRRWARRGTRPSAPHDQRTRSAYIFGAICPVRGTAAGLVLPRCNTAAMALHLAEISQAVEPGCHAVLLLDQAGWHLSDKLAIPDNITLMPLPAKSPELNPDRKHLAVHARQLALQPDIPVLRGHPRPLLPRLEQACRPALDDHVHRHARLGASVLISESWYKLWFPR